MLRSTCAGGVGSGTRSPRSGWLPLPVFAREGSGAILTDEDGNSFIDYVMGQGPLILGHRPRAGDRRRHRRPSPSAVRCSRWRTTWRASPPRPCANALPSVERVRFSSSGTEAAMYALRFARAYTGRPLIVRFEGHYHGWSDAIHWSAHPSPDDLGRRRTHRRCCPARRASPTRSPARCWSRRGTTPPRSRPCSSATASRSPRSSPNRSSATAGDHAGPWLPRADARADDRGRQPADLRRGADRLPRRARRRAGAARDRSRPDGAGQGARRRLPGRGARWPRRGDGDGRRRSHHARRHLQLQRACVRRDHRRGRADRRRRLLRGAQRARGSRLADGLVAAAHDAGLEACWSGVGGMFQLWFSATPPRDYREAHAIVAIQSVFRSCIGASARTVFCSSRPRRVCS